MKKSFEESCQKLAGISQRARELAEKVDENLTDTLSLMEFDFSLDGLGQLYNDLGKACEVSKLANVITIPGKCIDLAKKFADEVSVDWLGLDANPVSVESEQINSENPESELEEELDEKFESGLEEEVDENSESQLEEELDEKFESGLEEELDENSESELEEELDEKFESGLEEELDENSESELEEELDETSESESEEDLDETSESESEEELNESEEDPILFGVLTDCSESSDAKKVLKEESEVKPLIGTEAPSLGDLENWMGSYIQEQDEEYVSLLEDFNRANRAYFSNLLPLIGELEPNKTYDFFTENLSVDLNAMSEVSKFDDNRPIMVSCEETNKITGDADNKFPLSEIEKLQNLSVDLNALSEVSESDADSSTVVFSDKTNQITGEAENLVPLSEMVQLDLNALVEVSESHDGESKGDPIDKTYETTDEADNLVNFSNPLEFGEFEDIDLKDDWEDDIDYDLDLVSYYESKKSSKNKLAAKLISKLRHSKKHQLSKVAHKPEANSADSDWEIV